jgi:hypothetical protein
MDGTPIHATTKKYTRKRDSCLQVGEAISVINNNENYNPFRVAKGALQMSHGKQGSITQLAAITCMNNVQPSKE